MSKVVVVLLPSGIPEYLTVGDRDTTVTWPQNRMVEGMSNVVLPIETYYCEGEEFYFARCEPDPECELTTLQYI